jgi:hypothetical protein
VYYKDPAATGDPNNVRGKPWLDFFSSNADGTPKAVVDLIQYFAQPVEPPTITSRNGDTAYLFVYVYNLQQQSNQDVKLAVDSAQPYVLYFNGAVALSQDQGGNDITSVPLRPGQNELLVKVQRQQDQWQFQLRMLKDDGVTSINAGGKRNVVLRLRQLPGAL